MKRRTEICAFAALGLLLVLCIGAGVNSLFRFSEWRGGAGSGLLWTCTNSTTGEAHWAEKIAFANAAYFTNGIILTAGGILFRADESFWDLIARPNNDYLYLSNGAEAVIEWNGSVKIMSLTNDWQFKTPRLSVGPNGAVVTNILSGSATLNFPITGLGAVSDLPITVTGAASGDVVEVGVPQGSATGVVGTYSGFASNDAAFVRFTSTLAGADPPSGTFKVLVFKF